MSANHSDCRYAIRGDRVPVTGTRYTTFIYWSRGQCDNYNLKSHAQTVQQHVSYEFIWKRKTCDYI